MSAVYEIMGRPGCPECVRAKNVADREGVEYVYVDLDQSPEAMERAVATGKRQLPFIFKDEEYIGSTNEMVSDITVSNF